MKRVRRYDAPTELGFDRLDSDSNSIAPSAISYDGGRLDAAGNSTTATAPTTPPRQDTATMTSRTDAEDLAYLRKARQDMIDRNRGLVPEKTPEEERRAQLESAEFVLANMRRGSR